MKRLIVLVLALICVFVLILYIKEHHIENDTSVNPANILYAGTGEFSNERLKNAIYEYQDNYDNIVVDATNGISEVSFVTDFEVLSCSVTRLSHVDEWNINEELTGYIDSWIETHWDNNKVAISTDWWYQEGDSWVNDHNVWSYLVRVIDLDGVEHYYYFRTDYSEMSK